MINSKTMGIKTNIKSKVCIPSFAFFYEELTDIIDDIQ